MSALSFSSTTRLFYDFIYNKNYNVKGHVDRMDDINLSKYNMRLCRDLKLPLRDPGLDTWAGRNFSIAHIYFSGKLGSNLWTMCVSMTPAILGYECGLYLIDLKYCVAKVFS